MPIYASIATSPCPVATHITTYKRVIKIQERERSAMSSRRTSSSASKITEDEINNLIMKLRPLLPRLNQRRNGTVYIYIYTYTLLLFHLFVSNASCLSLFTYYQCLMYCMVWWWYIIRALIAALVQCQHGETEPCFNYNLAVITYIASTYAYFNYLFIYLEINNGSSCKNNPLRSRSQQNQVHRMHIQFYLFD